MTSANSSPSGRVLVVSGPSGVGKSTVCHRLCRELPADFSVSVTTRPTRPGEVDGRDYRFIDAAAYERLQADGALAEHAEVYGHRYGTPAAPLRQAVAEGRVIVLEIDIQGAIQIRRAFPAALLVFLLPPTPAEQARRITGRRTDSQAEIARRLAHADGEIRYAQESGVYDHFVINDDQDETVATIRRWLEQETRR
jgi:guanylate kinase